MGHLPVATAGPAALPAAAVALRGVARTYPDGTQALQPVDLVIRPGEFVTLLGPSGCGKSTLLQLVAGLQPATSGQVQVAGQPPGQAQGVSFVFQDPTLMPWASVRANVRLPLDLAGRPRAAAEARVSEALARVGLHGFDAHLPRQLSGGMRMRVSIARALVTQPALLLMDEPFAALDEITRHRLDEELLQLWRQQGFTVLFVTHSIYEAVYLSGRVLVMAARPGRIVDEVVIDEPAPRGPAFRVSAAFSRHATCLQDSLLHASGGLDGPPGPAPQRQAGDGVPRPNGESVA